MSIGFAIILSQHIIILYITMIAAYVIIYMYI